jgi:hypothetical protein
MHPDRAQGFEVTEPTEPATKGDVEKLRQEMHARFELHDRQVEGMRTQNSHEHGSLFTKLIYITEMLVWIKTKWIAFTRTPDKDRTWPGDKK